ncbi:MAG: alpha/beta hydrolase family protein [Flavobacteriales bacterium]
MKEILFLIILISTSVCWSQKKIIDNQAYLEWKKLEKQQFNQNGTWITYEVNPLIGDGYLHWYEIATNKHDSLLRSKDAQLDPNGQFIAWKVTPGYDTLRNCELNKVDKKKWPKDSLFIYLTANDSLIKIPKLKSFKIAEEGSVLAYLSEVSPKSIPEVKKTWFQKHAPFKKDEKPIEKPKSDGHQLTIWTTTASWRQSNVTKYSMPKNGKYVAIVTQQKLKNDSSQVRIYDVVTKELIKEFDRNTTCEAPIWNENGTRLAFFASLDTNKTKQYQLIVHDLSINKTWILGDTANADFDLEKGISENRSPLFTKDQQFLFFGVCDRVKQEPKDTLLESEKVRLDIWHYQDPEIQSQQLVQLNQQKKRSDLYVFHFADEKIIPLSNDTLNVRLSTQQIGDYLMATCDESYKIQQQWKTPGLEDVYRISILDGSIEILAKGLAYPGILSPKGKYFTYFNPTKNQHVLLDIAAKSISYMNAYRKDITWNEDLNGQPMEAGPEGWIGFDRSEDHVYFKSRYDIWDYQVSTQNLRSLTNDWATKNKVRMDLVKWESDSVYVDLNDCYVTSFNLATKQEGLHHIDASQANGLRPIIDIPARISLIERAPNKNAYFFRWMTVSRYPELELWNDQFQPQAILSVTNPQQMDYNWATSEIVKWKTYDGQNLEGILYKPENYDPSKKYPLLLYYYELNSDNLHNYQSPRPSASTINPTEYASAGYLVFIPDIRYEIGHPAKSAYNCIMSASDHLIKHFPVDSTRMGLQGQSWGGYQTAQLVTMTKRYAAAMAGAPVGNMISAYGGIRWGSGLNRQFQYESTQSRIGKTIWEAPELYIENSPLFHLPNVTTPLLIMSNDRDGAVPWYQGLELYNGMRRLGKPCWMLNYNDDDHNLTKLPYKMDLSIRMRQFFDHYLQGKPAPIWLKEGIPALEKGQKFGYETE